MLGLIVRIINVFLRIMLGVRLELLSFKLVVYLGVGVFIVLRILTNLNFKYIIYNFVINLKEV